uniref:Splicing factor 3b subunit 1 n=1 Tax=Sinocyclocheilus grahami TaxID=75366 RepID=A0A672STZ0_SINGR
MAQIAKTHDDIEAQILEIQGMKAALVEGAEQGVGLDSTGYYDQEIYGGSDSRFAGYVTSIAANEQEDDDDEDSSTSLLGQKKPGYHAPVAILNSIPQSDEQYDPFAEHRPQKISDREDEYKKRRQKMIISPERHFSAGGKTPDPKMQVRTYMDVMKEQHLSKEEREIRLQMLEKAKSGELKAVNGSAASQAAAAKRKRRWDQTADQTPSNTTPRKVSSWDQADGGADTPGHTPSSSRWDETPGRSKGSETPGATPSTRMWEPTPSHTPAGAATPGRDTPGHATPGHGGATSSVRKNRWDETPKTERETPGHGSGWAETPRTDRGDESVGETPTPGASKRKSRWDETPASQMGSSTPLLTPGKTPLGTPAMNMATPTPGHLMSMTPEQLQAWRWEREIDERNRPLTDEELDAMFPEGYKVLPPPAGYVPIRTPARKLAATPTPIGGMTGFHMQTEDRSMKQVNDQPSGNLPFLKPDDIQYFDKLLVEVDESTLSPEEQKERKIMKLLLKIKNGTPPMRKAALRQITDKAREFGAGPLFNQILPLLMSPTLEDQERHLLVKVIDRILYKLDDLVRPYVHKILVVIEPLLIDEDYYARVEGREIISNLAKAAGLATMISTMRPDIDNMDEYVRNTTARAFAVVASALGIPSLLPFLKAVCKSKKSWQARHTGIKIVQQIAILMGCAILPHLRSLVEIIEHGLVDEQQKVRTISALAIAALAEAATPYGIESFDSVLKPLWKGIRQHRGKGLAAFLKAIGYLIPLMDAEYANYYTREVMLILIREFQSPDEEMKKIVLKVSAVQCCGVSTTNLPKSVNRHLMGHLGVVLYEYLGEEYPEVLGSILGALKAIVNVIGECRSKCFITGHVNVPLAGMHKMTPPIKDLLPRLTPILKNRHEKVQENCIDLVGRIADRGAEYVSAREWMRICFELLELLKAHKKAIRRATVNTFGYIAKAIGPHDVLATLLNNLKVQERQNRVCTTVAIAIVAETCSPFTVLPALMNEYRVPELNVQNGVLKSLSFLFEYIGEMGKDYIYAVTPLLEDALMDRDLVHRQTASAVVQHMSLGVYGFGCEDSLNHLLNYVWPNVFETSPHVIQAVMGALEGLRVAIGPCRMLQYCLQGLFHPARKVRDVYWKIYNSIYIGSQDALIAHYPLVYNDEKNSYIRYELEYFM